MYITESYVTTNKAVENLENGFKIIVRKKGTFDKYQFDC